MYQLNLHDLKLVSAGRASLSSSAAGMLISATDDSTVRFNGLSFTASQICQGDECTTVASGDTLAMSNGNTVYCQAIDGGMSYTLS